MPLSTNSVHLDGVKSREGERRASLCSADSEKENAIDNLESELADLLPEMRQLKLQSVRAWPRGKVPYVISDVLLQSHPDICESIKAAMKTFSRQVASVEWVEQENEVDFVEFVYSTRCQSYMGCIGGRQDLELASWATTGTVLHEMGHAIGLAHEQCRLDRDRFVKVHMDRIEDGQAHNFEIITGAPLGPYDYRSIMHYPSCGFSKDGRPTIEAPAKVAEQMGRERSNYSKLDLKGIEAIYGPLQCTYEQHGEKYWPQYWFECRTCWGGASNYGCCLICALSCHSGPDHHLVPRELSPDAVFACDCGRNCHQRAVCTWHAREIKGVYQPLYHCRDCFKNAEDRCCYQCKKTCHAGHRVMWAGIIEGFCQCGLKDCCKITCRIPNPTCNDKCTYDRKGDVSHSQPWYECRTCWGGGSRYGCCLSCAFNCHRGHKKSYRPAADVKAVCDCGRNKHQNAVCTWHSTKEKCVVQPFYRCHDCFQDSHEGCCYQCMQRCHARHNTKYAGTMKAFCKCGLKSSTCVISCIIPGPLKCTYNSRGENYHSQHWYECRTCWGGESSYGCCVYCAFNCHKGHELVYHKKSKYTTFVCDCGRNHHQKAVCTWHATRYKAVKQPMYHCADCFKKFKDRFCYQCKKTCHAGHHVALTGIMEGYCKCGMECCQISCTIMNPTCSDKCTFETKGYKCHSQPWYECRTCWGGESNYGCCLSCAFNCHRGHELFYHPATDIGMVCNCGRNKHQKAVCTWHSTQEEYVMQPFYRCYDCFQDSHEGCCYQCVKRCHAGHYTKYAGIMKAFCDCGLKVCRINCIIPEPLECVYNSRGEDYHSGHWYECRTCWGGESDYGCCVYCAFNCHEGHELVHHQKKEKYIFVCACGQNRHKKSVCTRYLTETRYMKQPFYHCHECFFKFQTSNGALIGCCYQCVKNCHRNHITTYLGIYNTHCDCGLTCCTNQCTIVSERDREGFARGPTIESVS